MILLNKKKRTILFSLAIISFLISGLFIIAYSNGYRFDFQKRKFVLTGAIQLKVKPKEGLTFYLNSKKKEIKNNSLLGSNYFLDKLLPRKYQLLIKKDGFFSWQKNLFVEEKMTTFANSIILLPKEIKGKKIFSSKIEGKILPLKNNYFLIFAEKNVYLQKVAVEKPIKILATKEKIEKEFLNEEKNLCLVKTKSDYYLLDLTDFFSRKKINTFFLKAILNKNLKKKELKDVFLTKKDKKIVLVFKEGIYLFDWQKRKEKEIFSLAKDKEIKKVFFDKDNLFYQDKENNLFLFSLETRKNKLIIPKLKEEISLVSLSFDQKKLLLVSPKEVSLFYLKDFFGDFIRKKGEKDILFQKEPEKISWYKDSNHFWLIENNQLHFLETDPRENINIFTYPEIKNFLYEKERNILYFQKDNSLFLFDLAKIGL